MRAALSFSLATVCLLTLTSVPVFGQTTAEARKAYDANMLDAKVQFLKCDLQKLSAGISEDYTGVNAAGNVTKGRAASAKEDSAFCAANTVTAWDATTSEFHSSGPLAWAAGTLSMTYKVKATGKVETKAGRYLAIYAMQPDKKWRQQYFMSAPMPAGSPSPR